MVATCSASWSIMPSLLIMTIHKITYLPLPQTRILRVASYLQRMVVDYATHFRNDHVCCRNLSVLVVIGQNNSSMLRSQILNGCGQIDAKFFQHMLRFWIDGPRPERAIRTYRCSKTRPNRCAIGQQTHRAGTPPYM